MVGRAFVAEISFFLELGVEEGLDRSAGELEDELDEDDEDHQLEPPGSGNETVAQVVPDAHGNKMQTEDDGQHDAPCAATCQEYGEVSPLKVSENIIDDLPCSMERVGTEENPQEGDKGEGDQPRHKAGKPCAGDGVEPGLAQLVDTQGDAVTRQRSMQRRATNHPATWSPSG